MSRKKEKIIPGSERWKELRERAKTNLYFLNAKILNHEEIIPMTLRAHYGMCLFAERKTGIPEIDGSRIQLIQVGRGWGKSTGITKARTIQRLINNVEWSAGIANERQENADAFLATVKSELESNQLLNTLFPELMKKATDAAPVWKASRIILPGRSRPNPVNPSVMAAGTGATVTGVHMNEWIVDDLISQDAAENARTGSFSEIDKINRWVDRLQPLLTRPKKDPITFIGTPWWPGDCYDYVAKLFGRGMKPKHYNWQLRLPDGEVQNIALIQQGELAIFRFPAIQDGRAIFPEVFDMETLDQLREDNPAFFNAQYLLNPTAGALTAFSEEFLHEYEWEHRSQIRYRNHEGEIAFERLHDMQILMSIDPAISERNAAARSAITVVGSNGHKLFLLEAWAKRTSPTDVAMQILEFYKRYKPTRVIIESVAYQMALAEILTLLATQAGMGQLPIYEYHSGADNKGKMRITGLEPYFRKGLFYFHRKSQRDFLEEYTNFSPEIGNRTVDLLDALSFQKVSWEMLNMLGEEDDDIPITGTAEWRRRQKAYAQKIRERFSSKRVTREWNPDKYDRI